MKRRAFTLATLATLVTLPRTVIAGDDAPTDARGLLRAMAKLEGLEARFVERKTLLLLKAPLVSEGRIFYTRGGYMARLVEKPAKSKVRIGPTKLEVIDDGGHQHIDLRSRPDVKTFVESFVHVVAGDYDALSSIYTLSFEAAADANSPWLLGLEPTAQTLKQLVKRLEVRGVGFRVDSIVVLEAGGDKTEITLSDVDPKREFSAEERQSLFGLS